MARFSLEIWGEQVLLETRDIPVPAGGVILVGKSARGVFIAKMGADVPRDLFAVDDEVKLHHDAKILASQEGDYEYAVMRSYRDIACKVKRSLIEP